MHGTHWKNLTTFFGEQSNPSAITEVDILRYVTHRGKKVRNQTIRKELMTLKRGLALAWRAKWIGGVPATWPKLKSSPTDIRRAGNLHSEDTLTSWLGLMTEAPRDEALFCILTGVRATEMKRTRAEWVRLAGAGAPTPGFLSLPAEATKGRHARVVGLAREAMAVVERAIGRGPHDDGTLFGPASHRTAYRLASKRLGISPAIKLRDLRHYFGTTSLLHGGDLKATMETMGHRTLDAAELYQHSTEHRNATASAAVGLAFNGQKRGHQSGDIKKATRRVDKKKPTKSGE
jgi:site-specific recombinase XerD